MAASAAGALSSPSGGHATPRVDSVGPGSAETRGRVGEGVSVGMSANLAMLVDGIVDDFVARVDPASGATYWSSALRRSTAWSKPALSSAVSVETLVGEAATASDAHVASVVASPDLATAEEAGARVSPRIASTVLSDGRTRDDVRARLSARMEPSGAMDATTTTVSVLERSSPTVHTLTVREDITRSLLSGERCVAD